MNFFLGEVALVLEGLRVFCGGWEIGWVGFFGVKSFFG